MKKDELDTVHCFFEQSGIFKNQFKKMGFKAFDYDIQDNFGETDYVIDLFSEIDKAYNQEPSVFDDVKKEDLVMAFFPCLYFCQASMMAFTQAYWNYRNLNDKEKIKKILDREEKRHEYYKRLWQLYGVCKERGIRMIIENPATQPHFLLFEQNFVRPTLIDRDRSARGDCFTKPTAYWFVNFEVTRGRIRYPNSDVKKVEDIKKKAREGDFNIGRSLMTEDYARNFIADFIFGDSSLVIPRQLSLF